MESKTIIYFEWSDIKKAICKEMNIREDHFRCYHQVIGGEYKDLWHEWMDYFDTVEKDTIKRNDLGESMHAKLDWIKEDNKEWLESFVRAVYKVWEDNKIEYIRYFW